MRTLSINRPDDWHVHFREGQALEHTVLATASHFARALIMPNLVPALTTLNSLHAYRNQILAHINPAHRFVPYMTLYLNEQVLPDCLQSMKADPYMLGAKYYPAGATTHSSQGAHSILALYPLFEIMQAQRLVLQIHGEVTHGDIFNRESLFIKDCLIPLQHNFPKLRVVLEHISSKAAVDYVTEAPDTIAATITPHHLLFNRNDMLVGGIKPHYYCLPILKQARDQKALQQAAISGNPKFFAGTDSAPHAQSLKESACGCAGIFSAPFALPLYAQIFDRLDALNRLNSFMGQFGALFYELAETKDQIELTCNKQIIPDRMPLGDTQVIPIAAGQTIEWSVTE